MSDVTITELEIPWKESEDGKFLTCDMGEFIYAHFAAGLTLSEVMKLPAVRKLYRTYHRKRVEREIQRRSERKQFRRKSHVWLKG